MTSPDDRHDPVAWACAATQARIGLGLAGRALPTAPLLAFQLDHARARDAVHAALDADQIATALTRTAMIVDSRAGDRAAYLTRPDLGHRATRPWAGPYRRDRRRIARLADRRAGHRTTGACRVGR